MYVRFDPEPLLVRSTLRCSIMDRNFENNCGYPASNLITTDDAKYEDTMELGSKGWNGNDGWEDILGSDLI
eukprot:scaffold12107_cov277-Chaetoceros_neogracile.AAC.1